MADHGTESTRLLTLVAREVKISRRSWISVGRNPFNREENREAQNELDVD